MPRNALLPSIILSLCLAVALPVRAHEIEVPVSLRGSSEAMMRQNRVANDLGYTFAETPKDVQRLVEEGRLVRLDGNANYEVLDGVSFPYALPEVRLFIERLSKQYRKGTGEKLVVTSLVRPRTRQPGNASRLSVHPAGMAIDLRVSQRPASRQWLESVLMQLERRGVLDGIREYHPPHYHVALFPDRYVSHVTELIGEEAVAVAMGLLEPEVAGEAPSVEEVAPPHVPVATAAIEVPAYGRTKLLSILSLGVLSFILFGVGRTVRLLVREGSQP